MYMSKPRPNNHTALSGDFNLAGLLRLSFLVDGGKE
jgi:hypothetical protein